MKNLSAIVGKFLTSEDGPTAVEYAVMLALIIAVCVVGIMSVGSSTNQSFSNSSLQTATDASAS